MAPRVSISFAVSALTDLEAVLAWYAEQQVPEVGRRFVGQIITRIQSLGENPKIGALSLNSAHPPSARSSIPHSGLFIATTSGESELSEYWRSERLLKLPKL